MILEVDRQKIAAIKAREQEHVNTLPPHTLDWYTYSNRVALIEEIQECFTHVKHPESKAAVAVSEEKAVTVEPETKVDPIIVAPAKRDPQPES